MGIMDIVTICSGRNWLEYAIGRCMLRYGRTNTRYGLSPLCGTRSAQCRTSDKTTLEQEQISLAHPRDSICCYNWFFSSHYPALQSNANGKSLDNTAYILFWWSG